MLGNSNIISHMQEHKNSKALIVIMLVTTITVAFTFIFYGLTMLKNENYLGGIIGVIVGLIIAIIGIISSKYLIRRIVTGEVITDELSILQLYKAGYYSFVGTYYVMLFMLTFIDQIEPVRFVIYIGLGLNTVIFFIMNLLIRKQDFH